MKERTRAGAGAQGLNGESPAATVSPPRPPHAATVVQPQCSLRAPTARPVLPAHAATIAQLKSASGGPTRPIARPAKPVPESRRAAQRMDAQPEQVPGRPDSPQGSLKRKRVLERRNSFSAGDLGESPYKRARWSKPAVEDGPQSTLGGREFSPVERFLHDNQIMRCPATSSRVSLTTKLVVAFETLKARGAVSGGNPVRFPSLVIEALPTAPHRSASGKLAMLPKCVESVAFADSHKSYLGVSDRESFLSDLCPMTVSLVDDVLAVTGVKQLLCGYSFLWSNDYRVVIQFDYYPKRTKTRQALHRDSRGNTLFAFLVFAGDPQFTGTEIVQHARGGPRFGVKGVGGSALLPPNVKHAVERCVPKHLFPLQRIVVQETPVSGGDILGFVDPLVFHRTPSGKSVKRKPGSDEEFYIADTGKISDDFEIFKKRREQYLKFEGDTNSGIDRRFFRIWVTFEPKSLVEKLTDVTLLI